LTQLDRFKTVKGLEARPHYKILNRLITLVAILAFITLFLPWTQNISGKGAVTTLKPNKGHNLYKVSSQVELKNGTLKKDFVTYILLSLR
jgi:hypothetical protein